MTSSVVYGTDRRRETDGGRLTNATQLVSEELTEADGKQTADHVAAESPATPLIEALLDGVRCRLRDGKTRVVFRATVERVPRKRRSRRRQKAIDSRDV